MFNPSIDLQALNQYNLWGITVLVPSFVPQGGSLFEISSFILKPDYNYYISIPIQHIYITKIGTVPQQIQIAAKGLTTNPVIINRLDKESTTTNNYIYHGITSFQAQISFTDKISLILYLDNTYPVNTKMFSFRFYYEIYQQKKKYLL